LFAGHRVPGVVDIVGLVDGFSVDTDELHNVAKTDLPGVVGCVNAALSQLNTATHDLPNAFAGSLYHTSGMVTENPSIAGGDGFGVADSIDVLINDLVKGIGKLGHNLDQSATAVGEIANRYRAADGLPPYPK
jgi:hypothetical protein